MKIRIYTIYNYMDVELATEIDYKILVEQLEEGNTILLEKKSGATFILNNLNVLAIEILNPPHLKKKNNL